MARRYGSATLDIERGELSYETDRGKHWNYVQYTRKIPRLDFRVTLAQLAIFQTLDTAVNGDEIAFYYVPNVAVPTTAIYVRKEKGFAPKEYGGGVSVSGSITQLYDYSLQLTQEPTAAEILA